MQTSKQPIIVIVFLWSKNSKDGICYKINRIPYDVAQPLCDKWVKKNLANEYAILLWNSKGVNSISSMISSKRIEPVTVSRFEREMLND